MDNIKIRLYTHYKKVYGSVVFSGVDNSFYISQNVNNELLRLFSFLFLYDTFTFTATTTPVHRFHKLLLTMMLVFCLIKLYKLLRCKLPKHILYNILFLVYWIILYLISLFKISSHLFLNIFQSSHYQMLFISQKMPKCTRSSK